MVRGVIRIQASIYGGTFLWIHLKAYYFHNNCSITDVWLGYIYVSKNIKIFKVKLRQGILSHLMVGI